MDSIAGIDGAERTAPLVARIKNEALRLGFDRAGIAPAERPVHFEAYRAWVESGAHGEMDYLRRHGDLRADPAALFPGARSAIVAVMSHGQPSPGPPPDDASGIIARYARGRDYHDLVRERLRLLLGFVQRESERRVRGRIFVDTAPVLERDLAERAGIGWIGKNTNLMNARLGSYFFIGGVFVDIPLEPDLPEPDRCGTCTRCLDACPTGAFPAPGVLDARRCISYHTIELRGPIPPEFREPMGNLVFGCDICQEVCPYNRHAPSTPEPELIPSGPDRAYADLVALLSLDDEAFRRRFAGTAVTRTRRRGLARNAAVALGNSRRPEAVPALARALERDPEPLVRGHAAWALGRIGGDAAEAALEAALGRETEGNARREIEAALSASRA